ncbi:MAG: large conductance mechanosensitive channel protein MscL [Rhodospirillaceae bacterium]
MSLAEDFRKFALRGNLVDLAVGFTVGAAFSTVAKSLVDDVIMPPLSLIVGQAEFKDQFVVLREGSKAAAPYVTLADAQTAGAVTLNWGPFLNNMLALLLVALAMFAVIRLIKSAETKLEREFGEPKPEPGEPENRKCRFCRSTIPYRAIKCPQCTADLEPAEDAPI